MPVLCRFLHVPLICSSILTFCMCRTPKDLAPLSGVRRHIPSLTALSALSAQPFIDLHCARTDGTRTRVIATRGRIPQNLLDTCDDFYGDLADDPVCHTGDLAWIHGAFPWIYRPSLTFRHAQTLISLVGHLSLRPTEEEAASGAGVCVSRCTELVVRHFPQLLPCYERTIAEMFKRVIALYSPHSTLLTFITKCILDVSVPLSVREICETFNASYASSVACIMSEIVHPYDRMLFAINAGRLDLVRGAYCPWMIEGQWNRWLYAACYCGELGVLSEIMGKVFAPQFTEPFHIPGIERFRMLRIALITSNVDLVSYVYDSTVGEFEGVLEDAWGDVCDVACAKELIKRGYPLDGSLERCVRNVDVVHVLLASGAVCMPYKEMCAYCDYGPYVVSTLVNAWRRSALPFSQFVTVAVYQCTCPRVLRTLIRDVHDSVGSAALRGRGPFFLFNGHIALQTVSYIKTCIMLGVTVDEIDRGSGRTALDFAREMKLPFAARYLMAEVDKCADDFEMLSL